MHASVRPMKVNPVTHTRAGKPRQRATRGVGTPNLHRMYSNEERELRKDALDWLRLTPRESCLPLHWFFSEDAVHRIAYAALNSRDDSSAMFTIDKASAPPDSVVASLEGARARDVFEARLSRALFDYAFAVTIIDSANEEIESEDTVGDTEVLSEILPYSLCGTPVRGIGSAVVESATRLRDEFLRGEWDNPHSVADQMIIHYAISTHLMLVSSSGMCYPFPGLQDELIENYDYLLLFDPAADGIEDSPQYAHLRSTAPHDWFQRAERR